MSDITVLKTKEDSASKSLQITVPADRVREAEAKAVKYFSQRVRLPGFRPGKAPETVVRKRFNDAIRQTILEEMIRESWETAQSSEKFKPIGEPHIHNLKFEDGGPIEFEFHVEVRPDLKLARTGGFKLTRRVPVVTDAQVEERLRDLQERKANWLPVEGEKPAPGQMVRVEVAPIENGVAGASQPYTMVLGEGRAIPEVEERIMSLLPGETIDTQVKFPEDYSDAAKRGQTRQVRVTLHEVKRQELPALDDAFAHEVGDFESLAALRKTIREDLQSDADRETDGEVRRMLVEEIIKANSVEAPPSLVDRLVTGYRKAYQIPDDQAPAFTTEFRPVAETQVRRDLVLDAIAETNALNATEAEIDARISSLAAARNLPPAQLYAQLEKSNRLRELERTVTEDKVFAHLLAQSTVEEVSGS